MRVDFDGGGGGADGQGNVYIALFAAAEADVIGLVRLETWSFRG